MKLILLIFLSIQLSFAYNLKKSYSYDSSILYASDFFPTIKNDFEVIRMPEHLEHFNISQLRIFTLFEQKGIRLEGKPQGLVRFERFSDVNLKALKQELKDYYLENIPYLSINSVTIKATRHITTLPSNYKTVFKKQLFKHHKGSFKIVSDEGRIFFNYSIDASFVMLHASETFKKGTVLTHQNTKSVSIPFKRHFSGLLSTNILGKAQSRHYIKVNKPILKKDIQSLALVKKNATINIKLIEGNISINFTAKALKEARLNDSIWVKKSDGTKIKVIVIGKNKAVLQ